MSEYQIGADYFVLNAIFLKINMGVIVKPSWIEAGCLGLFAAKDFKEGETVEFYRGKVLRTCDALRLKDKSYLMRLGEQCYVDARDSPFSLARYINDCRNLAGYNVRFDKRASDHCAVVIATRDILQNEEIFADYGKLYWLGSELVPTRLSFNDLMQRRSNLGASTMS